MRELYNAGASRVAVFVARGLSARQHMLLFGDNILHSNAKFLTMLVNRLNSALGGMAELGQRTIRFEKVAVACIV